MKVVGVNGSEDGSVDLPVQFKEVVREDLVSRAVQAIQSHKRQSYGAKPDAGMRASAELSRRRRKYRGSYGKGISRIPRKIMTRRGSQMYMVGAIVPGTVGGRRAHAPKSEKIWDKKINDKERRKAIRSAMAAVVDKTIVANRGHNVPENYPFVIHNDFESLDKAKLVKDALMKLKLDAELTRVSGRTVRPGKGTLRGRKYKRKVGPLLVVGDECTLEKSARNIAGVEVVHVNKLNAELLAPGCAVGRLTLFTQNAIDKLSKEKLFM